MAGGALAVLLALAHVANDAITSMLYTLLPTLQVRFGLDAGMLAVLVAVFSFSSSITQPVFGALSDRLGQRLLAAFGLVLSVSLLSLMAVAPSVWTLLGLLVIGGLGSAAFHPAGTSIARAVGGNKELAVGLFSAGGMLGLALGPVLVLAVTTTLGQCTCAGAAVRPPNASAARGWPRRIALRGWRPDGSGVRNVHQRGAAVARRPPRRGLGCGPPGWTLTAFYLAAALGGLAAGALSRRIARRRLVAGSMALAPLPLLAVFALEPGTALYFGAVVLAGTLVNAGFPLMIVSAQDLAPEAEATASGMLMGLTVGAAGVLYAGIGQLQERVGLTPAMSLSYLALVPGAMLAYAVLARRPGRTAPADGQAAGRGGARLTGLRTPWCTCPDFLCGDLSGDLCSGACAPARPPGAGPAARGRARSPRPSGERRVSRVPWETRCQASTDDDAHGTGAGSPGLWRREAARLLVLMATAFLDTAGALILLPLLPFYAQRFGASGVAIMVLISAFSAVQLVSAPLWGRVSDRYGRRPALLWGLAVSGLGYLLFAASQSYGGLLLLSRLVQGAGGGTTGVIQAYVTDSVVPQHRARALGWLSAATNAGVVLGPLIGSGTTHLGGLVPGLLAAGLCVLNVAFAARFLRESHLLGAADGEEDSAAARGTSRDAPRSTAAAERTPLQAVAHVLWRPGAAPSRLIWMYAVGVGAFYGITAILVLLPQAPLRRDRGDGGALLRLHGRAQHGVPSRAGRPGGGPPGRAPHGAARGRAPRRRLGRRSRHAARGAAGTARPPPLAGVVAFHLVGAAFLFPSVTALLSPVMGERERGLVMGVQQTYGGLARVVYPLWAGVAWDRLGEGVPFWTSAALLASTVAMSAGLGHAASGAPAAAAAARAGEAGPVVAAGVDSGVPTTSVH